MQDVISVKTRNREELYDVTNEVRQVVSASGVNTGIVNVYVHGATAAIMIQEGADPAVLDDVVDFLRKNIPQGVWLHDRVDGNGDAHLKAGIIGPGETVPIIDGRLGLSTWQNIFLCEFDGPRQRRNVYVTVIST